MHDQYQTLLAWLRPLSPRCVRCRRAASIRHEYSRFLLDIGEINSTADIERRQTVLAL
ncbi:MAG: hypothetical protein U0528_01075 [Anaerolineae bacterium]